MKPTKHSNILPLVLVFLLITILVGGAYWYGKQSAFIKNKELIEEQEKLEASSSSKEIKKGEEVKVEENKNGDTEAEIILALQKEFALKYNRKVEDVHLTISKSKGDYIVGGVKFGDEMAGGYVLGAKVDGAWKIVFDGNGTIPCSAVDAVDFPTDLNAECWDTVTNNVIDRTTGQVKTY
jgi:hypothetical protein